MPLTDWNRFVKSHSGEGKSSHQLSKLYRSSQAVKSKKPSLRRRESNKPAWKVRVDTLIKLLHADPYESANVFEYMARNMKSDEFLEFMKKYADMYLPEE